MKFNLSGLLAAIFFPPYCLPCERRLRSGVLCDACRSGIALHDTLFCGTCRMRLTTGVDRTAACHPGSYVLGAAADYHSRTVKLLVHELKFRGIRDAAAPLGDLLFEYVSRLRFDLSDMLVIPIPLSKRRLRTRGFNQSELIAEHFARRAGLRVASRTLVRIRNTRPQSETADLAERNENVRGCFAALEPETIAGRRLILIDDVATSGATLREASRALMAAGAKEVIAFAAAIA